MMRLICGGSIIWKAILFEAIGCNLAGRYSKPNPWLAIQH
jgi:hypothetical protein